MERVSLRWMSITKSEIDCDTELDLATAKDILKESVSLMEDKILESYSLIAVLSIQVEVNLSLLELSNGASELAEVRVLATLC